MQIFVNSQSDFDNLPNEFEGEVVIYPHDFTTSITIYIDRWFKNSWIVVKKSNLIKVKFKKKLNWKVHGADKPEFTVYTSRDYSYGSRDEL